MSFDGSGNFVRLYSWQNDANNNVDITASRMDGEDNGFASGLSNCVTRDGQGAPTADFLPKTDNTLNLGSASFRWATLNGQSTANFIFPIKAFKALDTNRNTTTTLAADPDLTLSLASTSLYEIDCFLYVGNNSSNAAGFKFDFNYSGTINSSTAVLIVDGVTAPSTAIAAQVNASTGAAFSFASGGTFGPNDSALRIRGSVYTNASGTFALRWAQATSSGTNTSLKASSYLKLTKVG